MIEMKGSKVMGKLVYGVGISEKGEFKRSEVVDGKWVVTKEYRLWAHMLERCYSDECHHRQPTYARCAVSDNFKNFQWFAKWCQSQIGFGMQGYQLDKDILVQGNNIYSEDTCVFVPRRINLLLTKSDATRGIYPVGVAWKQANKKYVARCNDGSGKQKQLGYFLTPEDAFYNYKTVKEALIKSLADEYKGILDHRVFTALMAYTVDIND